MKPVIISIDGGIGSGKSRTLNILKENYPNFHFVDEPVSVWENFKDENGDSLLKLFYKDRKRWSYTFQNVAFMTRARALTKAIKDWKNACEKNPALEKNNVFITERCIETDFNVFAKMLHEDKSLNKLEWDVYRQWYRYLAPECAVSGIVYIVCSPEKCKERINRRSRTGEDSIPIEYLNQLHEYHEDWINNTSIPVLRFNSEEDLNDVKLPKTFEGAEFETSFSEFLNLL